MSLTATFLAEVDVYLAATGLTATAFGRQAVNDPSFVFDLRSGRSPSARVIDRVRSFIRDNPPGSRSAEPDAEDEPPAADGREVA